MNPEPGGGAEYQVFRCWWGTREGRPYLANLKVMRQVLRDLRNELTVEVGHLRAYVFVDDGVQFVVEGPRGEMPGALSRARAASEHSFHEAGGTGLWGEERMESLDRMTRLDAVRPLARLPVDRGLASTISEYPWAGGSWLLSEC